MFLVRCFWRKLDPHKYAEFEPSHLQILKNSAQKKSTRWFIPNIYREKKCIRQKTILWFSLEAEHVTLS